MALLHWVSGLVLCTFAMCLHLLGRDSGVVLHSPHDCSGSGQQLHALQSSAEEPRRTRQRSTLDARQRSSLETPSRLSLQSPREDVEASGASTTSAMGEQASCWCQLDECQGLCPLLALLAPLANKQAPPKICCYGSPVSQGRYLAQLVWKRP